MKKNSNPMDFTIFYCVILFPLLELCEKREMIEFQKCYIWVPKVIILKGGAPRFLHRFIHILKIIFWPEKKNKNFFPKIIWKFGCYFSISFDENMFYTVILNQTFELWFRIQKAVDVKLQEKHCSISENCWAVWEKNMNSIFFSFQTSY